MKEPYLYTLKQKQIPIPLNIHTVSDMRVDYWRKLFLTDCSQFTFNWLDKSWAAFWNDEVGVRLSLDSQWLNMTKLEV